MRNNPFNCVLLVDDDPITNIVNEKILLKFGLAEHVHKTFNGEEGLAFINQQCTKINLEQKHCPDLVLLDINMPVLDGFQVLEELKNKNSNVNVIVLTSSENPKDIGMANGFSILGIISKPLSEKKLLPYMPT